MILIICMGSDIYAQGFDCVVCRSVTSISKSDPFHLQLCLSGSSTSITVLRPDTDCDQLCVTGPGWRDGSLTMAGVTLLAVDHDWVCASSTSAGPKPVADCASDCGSAGGGVSSPVGAAAGGYSSGGGGGGGSGGSGVGGGSSACLISMMCVATVSCEFSGVAGVR